MTPMTPSILARASRLAGVPALAMILQPVR